jgi:hypothetical protein
MVFGFRTSISTIFQLNRGSQFYWWRKPEYPEKIIDKRYHVGLRCRDHMQSVRITTNVACSNPAHGEVYPVQHYVITFVDDFLRVLRFPPPVKLTTPQFVVSFCFHKSWYVLIIHCNSWRHRENIFITYFQKS